MAFIRPFRPSDREATAHICRATLPPSLSHSPIAVRLCPYLWTHQYTHLSPETCFVLDDGGGHAVGYCIGCPDVAGFVGRYDEYITAVLDPSEEISKPENMTVAEPWTLEAPGQQQQQQSQVSAAHPPVNETRMSQVAYSPFWLLQDGNEALLEGGYTATMHIDLLEEYQGKGWGRKLIDEYVGSLKAVAGGWKGKGIWIGIAKDNAKVVPFYEKMGFRLWDKADGSLCMVRDL